MGNDPKRGLLTPPPPVEVADKYYIDISDFENGEWKDIVNYFSPQAQIFLFACSTGKGGRESKNLANTFLDNLPPEMTVYSPQNPTNLYNLEINPDLTLKIEWIADEPYIQRVR